MQLTLDAQLLLSCELTLKKTVVAAAAAVYFILH